jgi:TonB-linked outer membrane protein, SusC/RagA family
MVSLLLQQKNGKAGKLNVDLNAYYGYNGWSITPKMRTAEAYLNTVRDAYSYVYDNTQSKWVTTGALWQTEADDATILGATRYATYQAGIKAGNFVDWAKEFQQSNAATQNYSINVSGGNEKTKGYISFNYTDENGQYKGDEYKLYTTKMRVDHNVKKWLTIGSSLQLAYVNRDKAQDKLENALTTDPLAQPYNADGTLNPTLGNNVYNLLLNYQPGVYANTDKNTKLNINPYFEIKPLKGLSLLSRASIWLNFSNNYSFDGKGSVNYTYNNANIIKAAITQNQSYGYQWENILTYNFKVAKDHDFTLTGVTTWNDSQNMNTSMNQSNILTNNFMWYNFTNDANTTAATSYSMLKTYGFVGRLNYSYQGKYLFSASMRRDGSSVLYKTNRWDNFPAVSGGWRISDESFMAETKSWLDNLKLRAGWGVTGSAKIDPYSSVTNLLSTNMSLGGTTQPIYRSSQYLTNADLGWEKSYNTNIGLDASFLNNRVDIALDYYNTKTDGVIWTVTSPSIYGTYTPGTQYQTYLNICQTQNKGFEFTINSRNIVTKDFEWSSSIAFATNKEKINKLTGGIANNITNGVYSLTIGQPVNSFRNYKLDGVWQIGQEKDAAVFNKRPGDLNVDVPGMTKLGDGVYQKTVTATDGTVTKTIYYADLTTAQQFDPTLTAASNKYTYSANDYQVLGHNSPDWSLGFQNTFKYKNFDLSVYMYMRWGQMISYNMLGWYQPNGFATNASPSRTIPEYFNYWTPTNPSNDFPVMNYQATSSTMLGFSGLNYVDGSFFKIKNITLGYSLPTKLLKNVSIEKFRLYGTITNPLVVAKSHLLQQYDPEMNGTLSYPLTKQVVVGLNVTF